MGRKKDKKVIWLATNNGNKAREFRQILKGWTIKTLKDLPKPLDIKETGETFEQNAMIKAKALANAVYDPAIGEDSGLCVKGLDGFPGIKSKRWALPETDPKKISQKLLNKMKKAGLTKPEDRDAEFVSAIAYYDPHKQVEHTFTGKLGGVILDEPRGENGFGYDPIFKPYRYDQSLAEMTPEFKNKISHRRAAVHKAKDYLQNQWPGMNLINEILIWVFSGED